MTKADKILDFMADVHFDGKLPDGIDIMNPYRESADIRAICFAFYNKFYSDQQDRILILGINPGRLGAGATGIPFTDTKRLNDKCGVPWSGFSTHEPSSAFMYEMIDAYGGPEVFYRRFYINSVCPLGFVKVIGDKRPVNYNYYDEPKLEEAVRPLIIENIQRQIAIAGRSDVCFCLGSGKNFKYLNNLNEKSGFFGRVVALEHPRFIMQYRQKSKENYVADYLSKFSQYP